MYGAAISFRKPNMSDKHKMSTIVMLSVYRYGMYPELGKFLFQFTLITSAKREKYCMWLRKNELFYAERNMMGASELTA